VNHTAAALLVEHAAELVTLAGPPGPRRGPAQAELGIITDGAVVIGSDGRVLAVGPTDEIRAQVPLAPTTRVIDARGRAVLPGFVDAHTHAVFAGDRVEEFAQRLSGAEYLEILAAGGGILQTVGDTRGAAEDALVDQAECVLQAMLRLGTTSVEIKSGYGLSSETELKLLRAIRSLGERTPLTIVPTLLAAHAIPSEFSGDAERYTRHVCEHIIPLTAEGSLARYCDVFCERGVFSVEQARRVLQAGLAHGLLPKLHAEQKSAFGGTLLGVELEAASVDHLEYATDADLEALAHSPTVAVLVPGAAFMLREARRAPARRLVELAVPVALATDFNPGTCPILSIPVVIGLACVQLGLSAAEALVAATINAAYAIGLGAQVGSLEPGKRGDVLILSASSHRYLSYYFASDLVATVIKNGRVVVEKEADQPPRSRIASA
jgi:imidazolonepropionase